MILPPLFLKDTLAAMLFWSFSTTLAGVSACWLVIRLSTNVEPYKLLRAVIPFWFKYLFKSLSWFFLLMESVKFIFDMTSISQQGSWWKNRAGMEFTFTQGFGHALEAALHYVWQSQVNSTVKSPELTFRFTWPIWL